MARTHLDHLAVQVLFAIWMVTAMFSTSDNNCSGEFAEACKAGTALGLGIGFVDILLAVPTLVIWCASVPASRALLVLLVTIQSFVMIQTAPRMMSANAHARRASRKASCS